VSDRYTRLDLAAKVDWEGCILDAIEYGIKPEQLPEDAPKGVQEAWARLYYQAQDDIRTVYRWLNQDVDDEPSGDSPDSPAPGKAGLPGGSDDYLPVAHNPDDPRNLWENITPLSPEEFMDRRSRCQDILDIPWNPKRVELPSSGDLACIMKKGT
jgi:hypothetical protein